MKRPHRLLCVAALGLLLGQLCVMTARWLTIDPVLLWVATVPVALQFSRWAASWVSA